MATDFELKFGAKANSNIKAAGKGQQPEEKAEYWINIGYVAKGAGPEGEDMFVSLPLGLPLDTQKDLKTNSSNQDFGMFQAARNELLNELKAEAARRLKPGQDWIVDPSAAITFQIRRVKEEVEVPVDVTNNKFVRKLAFAA
jgi:hypothetical protein